MKFGQGIEYINAITPAVKGLAKEVPVVTV
jgi:hypothetical protein